MGEGSREELKAAQAFARAEELVQKRRYEERDRADRLTYEPTLALRCTRAVGKLFRKLFGVERFLSDYHTTFWGWLLEVCAVSLFIAGIGVGIVGGIAEYVRGIHFPVGVEVIPVVMISASFLFVALTEEGWEGKLKGIEYWAIWTIGLLTVFYWYRLK